MELPAEIEMPRTNGSMKYAVILFLGFILIGFGFEGYFPYGTQIAIGSLIIGVPLTILMIRYDYFIKRTVIRISEQGILEIKKNKETFIRWTEYHQTYYSGTQHSIYMIPVGTVAKIQVLAEGKTIVVDYAPHYFQEKILQLSLHYILPELRRRLKKGVKLYFGPLELTSMAIFIKKKEIRRDHITKVKIENGKLVLKYDGSWFSTKIPVSDIPNFTGLVELLSEGYNPVSVKGNQVDVII